MIKIVYTTVYLLPVTFNAAGNTKYIFVCRIWSCISLHQSSSLWQLPKLLIEKKSTV